MIRVNIVMLQIKKKPYYSTAVYKLEDGDVYQLFTKKNVVTYNLFIKRVYRSNNPPLGTAIHKSHNLY